MLSLRSSQKGGRKGLNIVIGIGTPENVWTIFEEVDKSTFYSEYTLDSVCSAITLGSVGSKSLAGRGMFSVDNCFMKSDLR